MWLFRELGDHARVVFTDRHGGVSAPPFDSLNLGNHTRDDPLSVATNLRAVHERAPVPVRPDAWLRLTQVHGAGIVDADGPVSPESPEGDAAVTGTPGRVLVVITADCAPVALAAGRFLGVVHAGWRGLEAGVIEATVAALRDRAGPDAAVHAVLGPCIHPDHYEFGGAELDRVVAALGPEVRGSTGDGRPALDVPAAVRRALGRSGVRRFDDVDLCTYASVDHFSHRRDGETGRQALVAWMP